MPVSVTENAITDRARFKVSIAGPQPPAAASTRSDTPPLSVNLNAFESRFLMICWSRFESVKIDRAIPGPISIEKSRPLISATWRKVRST